MTKKVKVKKKELNMKDHKAAICADTGIAIADCTLIIDGDASVTFDCGNELTTNQENKISKYLKDLMNGDMYD